MKKVRFLRDGESPDLGVWKSGETRNVSDNFKIKGVAELVGDKPKKKREVKADGGE